jgi:hypothetical protein
MRAADRIPTPQPRSRGTEAIDAQGISLNPAEHCRIEAKRLWDRLRMWTTTKELSHDDS